MLPYSTFDSENPEDLWKYLANYEQKTRWNEVFFVNQDRTPAVSAWQNQAAGIAGVHPRGKRDRPNPVLAA